MALARRHHSTTLLAYVLLLASCAYVLRFVHAVLGGGSLDAIQGTRLQPSPYLASWQEPGQLIVADAPVPQHVAEGAGPTAAMLPLGPELAPLVTTPRPDRLTKALLADALAKQPTPERTRPGAVTSPAVQKATGTPKWTLPRYTACSGQPGESEALQAHRPPFGKEGVELVVTWHCESLGWLNKLSPNIAGFVSILILHKVDKRDLSRAECRGPIPKPPGFNVSVVQLPNCGRDVHSVLTYVGSVYSRAAGYTMFLQADEHWFVKYSDRGFSGFSGNADAINRLSAYARRRKARFLPVGPYSNDQPLLFTELESNIDKAAHEREDPAWMRRYDHAWPDMWNQARDTYSVLYGTSPCEVKDRQILFVPGFQFLVSREAITQRPQEVWLSLAHMALVCEDSTYGLERMSVELFNASTPTQPLEKWSLPTFCPGLGAVDDGVPKYFHKADAYHSAKFWRKKWGCEPLSSWLRERGKQSTTPSAALVKIPPMARECTWSIAYNVWYVPPNSSEKGSGSKCLGSCCADPACRGILIHSDFDSQCYWFTSLPLDIRVGRVAVEPLAKFRAPKSVQWSFIWKRP